VDTFFNSGCTAPAGETVAILDTNGNESTKMYPCFEHATLTDELDAKNISWKYYAPSAGIIWNGPNAIKHMCVPDPTGTLCTGSDWKNHVILDQTQVLSDVANGKLPAVSWVIPTAQASDHPQKNTGLGPSWVASVVNSIGNSAYWANTAIFITWDDWGGWYDHVAPPIISTYEYGVKSAAHSRRAKSWRDRYCDSDLIFCCRTPQINSQSSSGPSAGILWVRKYAASYFAATGWNVSGVCWKLKQSERSSATASAYPTVGKPKTSSVNFKMLPKSWV
jgi:phospholipase C